MTDNIVIKVFKDNSEKVILDNNKECIALYSDNWNDYGFMTLFNVKYFDKNGNELDLGFLKLGHKQMDNVPPYDGKNNVSNYLQLNVDNEISFDDNYFSLAQDYEFYSRLKTHEDGTLLRRVLSSLKEITIQTRDFIERIEPERVFYTSLLRNDFPKCIFRLTKLKNNFLNLNTNNKSYLDTYSFLNSLASEGNTSEQLNTDLEEELYLTTQSHINQFFLVQVVIAYLKKFPALAREWDTLLNQIKREFVDRSELVSAINYLQSEKGDIYNEFKNCISNLTDLLYLNEDKIGDDLVLGHYTSLNTLKELIKPESEKPVANLRLTNSRQLNDPLEGKIVLDYIAPKPGKQFIHSHLYLASATTKIDNLPMWKQYADDGQGVSLVYDNKYLKDILKNSKSAIKIAKVCYFSIDTDENNNNLINVDESNPDKAEIERILNKIKNWIQNDELDTDSVLTDLNQISLLFKSADYSYEDEYRIIYDTEKSPDAEIELVELSDDSPFPFLYTYLSDIPLKYKRVILGPKSLDIDYVAPYLKTCDESLFISNSRISYR